MNHVIVDTGPLVALLNGRDSHHAWARRILDGIQPPLFTCDAVLSEACFLVRNLKGGPDAILEMVANDLVKSEFRLQTEIDAVRKLMRRFASVPMSLADGCLVRMTELDRRATVLTLDGDFRIYRRNGSEAVPISLPD